MRRSRALGIGGLSLLLVMAIVAGRRGSARVHEALAGCGGGERPLVVIGLWLIPGNKKHKPSFYTRRLAVAMHRLRAAELPVLLLTDSDEVAADAKRAYGANPNASSPCCGARLAVQQVRRSELPHRAAAGGLPADCPTKWGKSIPAGQFRALATVWLSKFALALGAARGIAGPSCPPPHAIAWLDAGLSEGELGRAVGLLSGEDAARPGEVLMQHYSALSPKMRLEPRQYFGGRCPISHPLNAKVIWARPAALETLATAFDACLASLGTAGGGVNCSCYDEETVLAHMYHGRAPCSPSDIQWRPIEIYRKGK